MNTRLRSRRLTSRCQPKPGVYLPRRYLLTRNEAAFYRVLHSQVGDRYQISCKVRLADLITCSDRDWKRGHANRIAQKHVDFVLCRPLSSRILVAVELDDRSHLRASRQYRDRFVDQLFRSADIRLIRVPARWNYDDGTVARFLADARL